MKFQLDSDHNGLQIRSYGSEGIVVGDALLEQPVALCAEHGVLDLAFPLWNALDANALQPLIERAPDILLVGTGGRQRMFSPALYAHVLGCAVGLEVMDTGAACRSYNVLVSEQRSVVALLYPASDSHLGE